MNSDNIAYILDLAEKTILFAGKNMDEVKTLHQNNISLTERDICEKMALMYQKGIITNSDDTFIIEPELDGMLETIKNATDIVLYRVLRYPKQYIKLLYIGEKYICEEKSVTDFSAVKLFSINNIEEFLEWQIYDEIDDSEYVYTLDEEEISKSVFAKKYVVDDDELEKLPNVNEIIEVINAKTGFVRWRGVVKEEQPQEVLCVYDGKQIEITEFEKTELKSKCTQVICENRR